MTLVQLIAAIAAMVAVLLALAFWALFLGVNKVKERAERCKAATKELLDIEAAAREADREKSKEKCEEVNRRIDAWNAKYANDCADGKTIPKLDCK